MECPNCRTEYVCPCSACREQKSNKISWIRIKTDENNNTWDERCSNCGLTKDIHEWLDIEYEQYQNLKNNEV